MTLRTRKFDIAEYLESDSDIAEYLSDALAMDDPAYFQHALGAVARAKGMAWIARKTGLGRQSLYKALSESGNPEFATVMKVLSALGVKVSAAPADARSARSARQRARRTQRAA